MFIMRRVGRREIPEGSHVEAIDLYNKFMPETVLKLSGVLVGSSVSGRDL
jgi:hypothetical protein